MSLPEGVTLSRFLRWRDRLLWFGLPLLGIAALLAFRHFAPVTVRVSRVERGDLVLEVFGRGTVESRREAQLGFELVGRVSSVLVDEGDRIKLGQALAYLQPEQYRAELRTAASGVSAARATLGRLEADERRAREALSFAEQEERRQQKLGASGAIASVTVDAAVNQARLARAELDRVLASRSEATRGIEVATGTAEQRRVMVLRATLLAPFDALVTRRFHDPGDTVAVGATVLRVVDTQQLRIRAWVDETTLGQLSEGQPVEVRFPGAEAPALRGTVDLVGWEADRQTHELLVDIELSALPPRLALGQRADAWIEIGRRKGVLAIPNGFVRRDQHGPYCYVDRAGRIEKTRLALGRAGRDRIEVLTGLRDGDVLLDAPRPGASLPAGRRWKAAP
jgi:RND family efflux transporter MFP subunit